MFLKVSLEGVFFGACLSMRGEERELLQEEKPSSGQERDLLKEEETL